MKKPRSDIQNLRIVAFAKWFLLLPITLATGLYALACRWRKCAKSEQVVHDEDVLRQSRVRRTLRGLPQDHIQAAHGKRE